MKKQWRCTCRDCKEFPILKGLLAKCNMAEMALLRSWWSRLEAAETDVVYLEAKRDGTWPSDSDAEHREVVGPGLTREKGDM